MSGNCWAKRSRAGRRETAPLCPLSLWERVRVRVLAASSQGKTLTPALSQREREQDSTALRILVAKLLAGNALGARL
jgi:hypothetical protein